MGLAKQITISAGLVTVTTVTVLAFAYGSTRSAAQDVCADLEAQLAAMDHLPSGSQPSRYDRTITTQQSELRRAHERKRLARCDFGISGDRISKCAALNSAIARMEQNLLDLQSRRVAVAGGDASRERARILANLNTNGCRETRSYGSVIEAGTVTEPAASGRNFTIIGGAPREETGSVGNSLDAGTTSFVTPRAPGNRLRISEPRLPEPIRVDERPQPAEARPMDEDRNVRVVGPRFLPDPEEAINLRAPAQTHAR